MRRAKQQGWDTKEQYLMGAQAKVAERAVRGGEETQGELGQGKGRSRGRVQRCQEEREHVVALAAVKWPVAQKEHFGCGGKGAVGGRVRM